MTRLLCGPDGGRLPHADQAAADLWRLIAVQNRDGSLVVGDSHHYAATPDPFQPGFVDDIILAEFAAVFGAVPPVIERWVGVYPSGPQDTFTEHLGPGLRLISVTSGAGASTSFAIAEETMDSFA